MSTDAPYDDLAAITSLGEPTRRALYLYVSAQGHDVSRDEAADALGLRRSVAAFHLDRLVSDGLLTASYRRLSGRSGPGAGRPAKLYRRSALRRVVSLPPRQYELVARILADAVSELEDRPEARAAVEAAVRGSATRAGKDVGRRAAPAAPTDALAAAGFEPDEQAGTGTVLVRNCPFHELAEAHRQLVCNLNLAFVQGLLRGLGSSAEGVGAHLEPAPGRCCLTLSRDGAPSKHDGNLQ
jgi:predicted ArsR family transcriptional regulator